MKLSRIIKLLPLFVFTIMTIGILGMFYNSYRVRYMDKQYEAVFYLLIVIILGVFGVLTLGIFFK